MHPSSRFAWADEDAMRAFVSQAAFAQIVIVADGKPMSAQAPVVVAPDGSVRFHLARANQLVPLLDGAAVLASVTGTHFYVSPDWYGTDDQVPTWNYRMVEIEGVARRLDEPDLRDLLDRLSAAQEKQLAPKPAWTAAKMDQRKLDMMLRAIVGFAIDSPIFSGRIKMGQNKLEAERRGAIAALRAIGKHAEADEMEALL
jgi:transcriptional regulator